MGPKEIILVIATVFAGLYENVRGSVILEASHQARSGMEWIYSWLMRNAERHEQLGKAVSFVILLFCVARQILFGSPISFILWAVFPYLLPFALGVYVGFFISNRSQCATPSLVVASSDATPSLVQPHHEHFNSSDYTNILDRAVPPVPVFPNDAALYFFLCNSPILLDDGNLRFSLHASSCKKCWMLGAKHLMIRHADIPKSAGARKYWIRKSVPESRFSEVAELEEVWHFEIRGLIETSMLSPETPYAAYLVYRLQPNSKDGFQGRPIMLRVTKEGCEVERSVFLDTLGDMAPKSRGDGFWMEQELSDEIFNKGDNATLEFLLLDDETSIRKSGLIVEGIELRPKPVL